MARKKKFRPGMRIWNVSELVERLDRGDWMYMRDTPKHPSVLLNMSVTTLRVFCHGGSIREAILNEEE